MPSLTIRLPDLAIDQLEITPLWLGNDAFRTHLFNALSMLFPVGEKYFIDTARDVQPLIEDPMQKEELRRFIGQESQHSRLHRQFNQKLEEQGLYNQVEPVLAFRIRISSWMSLKSRLAIAMAYEHFTAILGDNLLAQEGWLAGASSPMKRFWQWHAAEESEHRAVLFNAYRAVGGGYVRRVGWFAYVSIMLALDMTIQTVLNLSRSKTLLRWRTIGEAMGFLFGRHGVTRVILPAWVSYFRPGFSATNPTGFNAAEQWLADNQGFFRTPPSKAGG